MLDPIKDKGRDGFEAVCWYLAELAAQGELYRRREGQDAGPIPEVSMFQVCLSPLDMEELELQRRGLKKAPDEGA